MKKVLSLLTVLLLAIILSNCGTSLKEKLIKTSSFQTEDMVDGTNISINFNSVTETVVISSTQYSYLSLTAKYRFTHSDSETATLEMTYEKTGEVGIAYITLLGEKDGYIRIKWETKALSTTLKGRL